VTLTKNSSHWYLPLTSTDKYPLVNPTNDCPARKNASR